MSLLPNEHVVSLITLNQGAAIELFQKSLEKVLANIADVNCEREQKREIVLSVKFKPRDDRSGVRAEVEIKCETKLAAHRGSTTMVFIDKVDGELAAVESDPTQGALFDKSETKKGLTN